VIKVVPRGWEVWFKNDGDTPFLGTVAFEESEKNKGYGFESMALPDNGTRAMQPILAAENYGLKPVAKTLVRVAIRGYGNKLVRLPEKGELVIRFDELTLEGESKPRYFERDLAVQKREEKRLKVQFFNADGSPFNNPFQDPHSTPPRAWWSKKKA
jgi:hypothetical protein